jgi:hypothetical protein
VKRAPYVFTYASTYAIDCGGRRAVPELYGAAGRPAACRLPGGAAVFHTDNSERPGEAAVTAGVGHAPRMGVSSKESAVVGAALSFGVDLLRGDIGRSTPLSFPSGRAGGGGFST